MARNAIDIIIDNVKKIKKDRKDFRPAPFYDANLALELCDPAEFPGNNKSEWIKRLTAAAAHIVCEIETIQRKRGDGII